MGYNLISNSELSNKIRKIIISDQFKYSCISITIFTFFLFIFSSPWRVLTWDEVDYFNASSKGFLTNALDTTSLGFSSFLSFVYWKLNLITNQINPIGYNEKIDTFFLRHCHPPLLQYLTSYFSLISPQDYKSAELAVFLSRWGLGSTYILSAFFISDYLFPRKNKLSNKIIKIIFISYAAVLLSIHLQYHILIAISLLYLALTLNQVLKSPTRKNYLFISFAISFSILSLETSLVAILTSTLIYFLVQLNRTKRIFSSLKTILIYFWILPTLLTFIFWPGALIKINIFKAYGLYVYKVFQIKEEYSNVFSFDTLLPIYILLLVFFVLLLISIIYLLKNKSLSLWPIGSFKLCFILGISYSIFMVPFNLTHTYMIPGLFLASIPVLEKLNEDVFEKWLTKTLEFILIGSISIGYFQLISNNIEGKLSDDFPGKESLNNLSAIMSNNKISIYSDAGHVLKFYLPDLTNRINEISLIKRSTNSQPTKYKIFTRDEQKYSEITNKNLQKPSLILVREDYKNIIPNLEFNCKSIKIDGLLGSACLVEK